MKIMNKKFIVLGLAALILITGTTAYASGTFSSLFPNASAEQQEEVKKIEYKINQS
ncbi:hypothetical protein [Paenibacillus sp. 1001270B_150601_E10]|uniref:hypothetical protein n=1 Tax=Paenibacillus sp. 1001270B_150601_E10 TaxID=2787079 RepID=UPI00189E922A|nr:hypothetical protein [Paenibacillus sp. 1001270B_150601_E10]